MGLKDIFTKVKKATTVEVMKGAKELADELFTSREEKNQFLLDTYKEATKDRQSAREMFIHDSWLQKSFAILFLASWLVLTYLLLNHFVVGTLDLEEWQIALISTIYGGINTKLNTIVDFLFGGSATLPDKK